MLVHACDHHMLSGLSVGVGRDGISQRHHRGSNIHFTPLPNMSIFDIMWRGIRIYMAF